MDSAQRSRWGELRHGVRRCLIHLAVIGLVVWFAISVCSVTMLVYQAVSRDALSIITRLAEFTFIALAIFLGIGVWVSIVIVPTFTLSQALLGIALVYWHPPRSIEGWGGLVAAVLALSWLSFTCYDYLVPSYRWYTDLDEGWVHGLSMQRLLPFIAIQSCLAAFSFWRLTRRSLAP